MQLRARAFLFIGVLCGVLCLASAARAQLYSITTGGQLYRVDTTNASTALVGNTGIGLSGSLEYNPADGFLYCMEIGSSPGFYRINPATAAATLIGGPGVFVFEGGLQFSPGGVLYGTNQDSAAVPQLFTVNLATGTTSVVGTMSGGERDINGLAWRTTDGMLIGIDRASSSLVVINPLNAVVTSLAAAPEPVGNTGGMAGLGTSAFYNTESDRLYSVNLLTGASALIGQMNIDSRGLALVPEPGALAPIAVTVLVLVRRRRYARAST